MDSNRPEPGDWLDTRQLAARLEVHPRTVERWRREGKGPAWHRIGGRIRYRWADVLTWLREHRSDN